MKLTVFAILLSCCSMVMGQQGFEREQDIPDGKCVVYVFRDGALTGAALSQFGIQVAKENVNGFSKAKTGGFYQTYAKLRPGSYAPIILDADVKYRLIFEGPGVPVYFSGVSGSETVIKIKGASYPKYDCIKGMSSITRKTFIKEKFEKELIAGESKLDVLKENSNSKLLKKLKSKEFSVDVARHIYK